MSIAALEVGGVELTSTSFGEVKACTCPLKKENVQQEHPIIRVLKALKWIEQSSLLGPAKSYEIKPSS